MTCLRRALALALPLVVAAALTPLALSRSAQVAEGTDAVGGAQGAGEAGGPVGAAGTGGTGGDEADAELLEEGARLYSTGCSTCHGADGRGVSGGIGEARGPSLENAGGASAFYYLSTGRMPLSDPDEQPRRKQPAYTDDQVDALVAYVATLGDGPDMPALDMEEADIAEGGAVYRSNCQPCHSASGSGGALSYGQAAPRLAPATPEEVAAAVRAGPGQMPTFGEEVIPREDLDDLVRYVEYLDDPADPGGVPIGRIGPIPEGFVAWLVGMVALLMLVAWIGTRASLRRARS